MKTQKLYYTKYFCPQTLQILVTADIAGIKIQATQINKKYDSINLVTQKGVLNRSNSILRYLSIGNNLNGTTQSQRNQLNTWFEYFNMEIYPLLTQLYSQIFGQKQTNQVKYNYCLQQITKNLKVLDECLKIKTFFVGNNLTIFDITLACYLQNLFKLIVTEGQRKKFINLFRWFNYVREIPVFSKYYGKKILCGKDAFKIEFTSNNDKEKAPKGQQNVQKKQKKKDQSKKTAPETKNKDKKTEEKQPTEDKKQKQEKQQKPQNDAGGFKLDDFKRQFQNSSNQKEVFSNLLNNFPKQKLSIWRIYYLKDVTEGKVLFLTQNLANGSLQRIQNIRKSAFGSWGVFGQQGNYEIRGVMIWQGQQIHPVWKQHPAFQYHEFKKLSPQNAHDQQLIYDYILQHECAQGLMNKYTKRIV